MKPSEIKLLININGCGPTLATEGMEKLIDSGLVRMDLPGTYTTTEKAWRIYSNYVT